LPLNKKVFLVFGVVFNLGLLGFFKYCDFFIQNIIFLFGANLSLWRLTLPLAISFFTFQQIAYLVDSYAGKVKERRFLSYVTFVSFFPQLIAGPIVHHKEMMPQFSRLKNKVINYNNISAGLLVFAIGLFKKVVLADNFSVWVNEGFDVAQSLTLVKAWMTILAYAFQIYFDFSGYSDMAIGAGLLFNIKLPINFYSPYKATDIQDFWKRWHVTLSRFLKDYLYIPLGGNRNGSWITYRNLIITFLLGGLWHGASWMFVIWGALHGLAIVIHRIWKSFGIQLNAVLSRVITFV
jgi:D-alanyl-lipoteichoic acid acyltransferase DltB (MBOAT superfamily)